MKKYILIFTLFFVNSINAETLRNLAKASNAFLVIGDLLLDEKTKTSNLTCQIKFEKISPVSQALKSLIDQKVRSLIEKDYLIIQSRLSKCKAECTCDIYAYAFENKDSKIAKSFSSVAETTTSEDRLKCYKQIAAFCDSPIFKSILKDQ